MKIFIKVQFFIFVIISFFVSCKSVPDNGKDYMYVMIYDYENNTVKDVCIFVDEKLLGQTDINGRFFIPITKEKTTHKIKLLKKDYQIIEEEFEFRAGIVLYYKIASSFYYFAESEKYLDKKELDLALKNINKALDIEIKDEYLFLKSIVLNNSEKIEEANKILQMIKTPLSSEIKKVFEENYEN